MDFEPVKLSEMPRGAGRLTFVRRLLSNPATAAPAELRETRVFSPRFAQGKLVYVADADVLETIFVERPDDFPKGRIDERILRPIFNDGLLLAEGADWRWKRRLAAPVFSPAAMKRFMPGVVAPFAETAAAFRAANGRPVDAMDAMKSATLAVIDRLLFGAEREIDPERIKGHVDDYLAPASWMVAYALFGLPGATPFPGRGKLERARVAVRALLADFVARRRAGDLAVDDLCNRLITASDPETGRTLSDGDMVDMLLTLQSAGHETSANALSWAIHLLTRMPAVQERLVAEIDAAAGGAPIGNEHLPHLAAVRAFVEETMRLFPPAPSLSRTARKAETLSGVAIEAGAAVLVPIHLIHRHPAYWERPDVFDLDRFMTPAAGRPARTVYMPFGAGPKICVGAQLAMTEMTAGLATLLQHVRFASSGEAEPRPLHRVTLRPAGKLMVIAEPRRGAPTPGFADPLPRVA
ncbi:cytochrome P450 [Aurantimonas sp. 22II-16-19i]|uniref:cytochrome P450 n=1 Tax=Aurantimonas sp. 22II-16-19i TaxID=1317114 RepID=UPI0009F7D773|nr:cytochrome P450 [Aurantimonas sp. 22II-16-19i]ORE97493.1 cytochrome P450 [Aurantimonas sp. 22II-16-19i]